MVIRKYLNPKNDVAFKRIFGTEKNKDILISMLNAVVGNQLHTPIHEITFLSPFQEPEAWAQKQSVVDVLCKDQDDCQYIIEMQVANAKGFEERAQYYASKAFINQCKEGGEYENLKEVIFLAFCDFSIFPKKADYKSEHVILDKKTQERDLDKFSFTFVDLIKFDEQRAKSVDQLTLEEKFYYFLKHAEDIDPQVLSTLIGQDKIIKKAFHELERFGWSEEEMRMYDAEVKRLWDNQAMLNFAIEKGEKRGLRKGRKEGIKKGRTEGIKEGKQAREKEIARQMLAKGLDINLISEVTGLTPSEISQLGSP